MFVVAGASGNVGSVVAKTLLAQGRKVRVIVRDAAKAPAGAEAAAGVLEDQAFLAGALRGASGFFTLLPPNYQAADFFASQRKTADAIAGAVRQSAVPHVVMLSSVGADLEAGTGPIKGLHDLEGKLRETGAKLTLIRAGSFQENFRNALGAARGAGIYPSFAGSADYAYPMIATKDIGALAAQALLSPPAKSEVVDLHGPAYSDRQVAQKLGKALGRELKVVEIPAEQHLGALVQAGFSKELAAIFAEMYAGFASGKIAPRGDRLVQGKTKIDEAIAAAVAGTPR